MLLDEGYGTDRTTLLHRRNIRRKWNFLVRGQGEARAK